MSDTMTQNRLQCRCGKGSLGEPFLDLGRQPLANSYVRPEDLDRPEAVYPLRVFRCPACGLVQLADFDRADEIFNDEYAYFSSYSNSWLEHARLYVESMIPRFNLGPESLVVEVASNDGYLLQYFVEKGIPVLGVEPTANTARAAQEKGIPTEVRFFGRQTAEDLKRQGKSADLLLGNNVLAHVPDLMDFIAGMKILLKPSGVITMEFPHLVKLIEHNQFDTIYHEHFSYYTATVVDRLFAGHGLKLFDVEEMDTHGGSLRIYARHADYEALPVTERLKRLKEREEKEGYLAAGLYESFSRQVEKTREGLRAFFRKAHAEGKTVVAYGAPAKGNTLLNYCEMTAADIPFTVDRSPHKQGRYLPGSRVPVREPEAVFEARPDYLLILPWNLKREIAEQMKEIRTWGGKFVVPIPEVEVW